MKKTNSLIVLLLILSLLLTSCSTDDNTDKVILDSEYLKSILNESLVINNNVPGVVALVDRPSEVLWKEAIGFSNIENETNMSIDNQFIAASITKTFIATIILQMHEEGLLNIEDNVSNFLDISLLDDLTLIDGASYGSSLKIIHLLNHTSGIFDYLDNGQLHLEAFQNNPTAQYTNQQRITAAIQRGQPYAIVGNEFHYSNTNYILLSEIIEIVTNQNLEQVMNSRIFTPLQMSDSHIGNPNGYNNLAEGYFQDFNLTAFSSNFNFNSGDGGLVTTVDDLHLFARALFSGSLFENSNTIELMKHNYANDYGLGIRIFNSEGNLGNVYGHDGSDPGYFAYLVYAETSDTVIIYAGNRAEVEVENPAFFINSILQNL
jgi:D-alanyl-D-alanine carboxypeptidase